MAWTAPRTWTTGELVTKTIMDTHVRDQFTYLKGTDGPIVLEDLVRSDTDVTDDLGTTAILWRAVYARTLFGSRMRVNPNIREVRITWEDDTSGNYQVAQRTPGAGTPSIAMGGTGQIVLKVDNDAAAGASAALEQQTEQNNALDNAWTVTKNPYIRVEFSLNLEDSKAEVFIGFRATIGGGVADLIPTTTERHAGLLWNGGANWQLSTGDGTTTTTTNLTTDPTVGARNVVEVYIKSATEVELWLNGVRQIVKTTNLPTGALEWAILLATDGTGAASDSLLTVGEVVLQEEVP